MYSPAKTLDILAVIAHELKNHIECISGYAQLLSNSKEVTPAERRACTQTLLSRCRAAATLIQNLTDETVLKEGGFNFRAAPVALQDLVRQSVEAFDAICRVHGVTLASHMPDKRLVVEGDARRLQQILDNLICNALKRLKPGGKITLVVYEDESRVCIGVVDNGEGIESEECARLFEIDRPRESQDIGFFIAKTIVEAHGGEIGVYSAGPGKGSTFHFDLPKVRTPRFSKRKVAQRPCARSSKKRRESELSESCKSNR